MKVVIIYLQLYLKEHHLVYWVIINIAVRLEVAALEDFDEDIFDSFIDHILIVLLMQCGCLLFRVVGISPRVNSLALHAVYYAL